MDRTNVKSNKIIVFDTSMDSDNIGDDIIMKYSMKIIHRLFPGHNFIHIPTHCRPTTEQMDMMPDAKYSIVCGTNILCPNIRKYSLWKFPADISHYKNIILLGAGWNNRHSKTTWKSRKMYRQILSSQMLHSVRSSFCAENMKAMWGGVNNVLNTGCVTMWFLKEDGNLIPHQKAENVVFTLTAHRRDIGRDLFIVNSLKELYKTVYFFPQGDKDLEYLNAIMPSHNLIVLPRSLDSYEGLLRTENIEYVGTRLHGGIHALNYGKRSLIIEVDHRASVIAQDTGLPTISAVDVYAGLKRNILHERITNIKINHGAIQTWMKQFICDDTRIKRPFDPNIM